MLSVRLLRQSDLAALQEIERRAGEAFRGIGMAAIADDDPPSLDELSVYQRAGHGWVVTDDQDCPIGYLLVEVVDGAAHIEQVSIDPDYGRRRLGVLLVDAAEEWARRQGMKWMTLTTYAEVPWNAPYYERLGFQALQPDELTEGLATVRRREAQRGLDTWPRVAMRRAVPHLDACH